MAKIENFVTRELVRSTFLDCVKILPADYDNSTATEAYVAFDPGLTTGIAAAVYDVEDKILEIVNVQPFLLNEALGKFVHMDSPPVPCYKALYDYVDLLVDELTGWYTGLVNEEPENNMRIHVAIEDFTGGTGGNLQNTVNKLIGVLSAVCWGTSTPNIAEPKIFRNSSRRPYLPHVAEITAVAKYKGMSHHSKDALAHLLHLFYQNHSDDYRNGRVEIV